MDNLEREILLVQRSTKTLFRFMIPAHELCRNLSVKYYNWHLRPYAEAIHWLVFVCTLATFGSGIYAVWPMLIRS